MSVRHGRGSPVRVVVAGGGFAGVAAAARLAAGSTGGSAAAEAGGAKAGRRVRAEVVLLDPKSRCEMLPLLPDIAVGRIGSAAGGSSHRALAAQHGYRFVQNALTEVDLRNHRVTLGAAGQTLAYDFLLLSHGGQVAFYGNESAARYATPLRSLGDAMLIRKRLAKAVQAAHPTDAAQDSHPGAAEAGATLLVVGGGYTGVELATHLQAAARRAAGEARGAPESARGGRRPAGRGLRVVLLEAGDEILAMQEPWMRRWAIKHLRRIGVEVVTGTTAENVAPHSVQLSDGTELSNVTTFWTAGMRVESPLAPYLAHHAVAPGGRLTVDEYLRVAPAPPDAHPDTVFAAGDAAAYEHNGATLPPASYIAAQQGGRAADNILRAAAGRPLRPYRPIVHGFVIPVAGGSGCGRIHGVPLIGRPVAAVHYLAAVARAHTPAQRATILRDLLRRRARQRRAR